MDSESSEVQLKLLVERYLNNSITESEKHELFRLIVAGENTGLLQQVIEREFATMDTAEMNPDTEVVAARIYNKIVGTGRVVELAENTPPRRKIWVSWAAASVLIVVICAYFIVNKQDTRESVIANSPDVRFDLPPGRNNAILTLSDGTKINLDSAANGSLAREGNTFINKSEGGLLYSRQPGGLHDMRYNTISTARGNQYTVVLSDGTKVWLNAASSITFPAVFTGDERNVKISGEAYFEVAPKKNMPFRVSFANNYEVVVLGTHSNINSYTDENNIRATLIEGSVRVSKNGESYLLQPGQEAQMKENTITRIVRGVDTESVIAWKEGFFSFKDADIQTVMRQLSRWYDLDIEYEGKPGRYLFTGDIDRSLNLISVLKILEKTRVRYRMEEGRKLIILP